MQYPDAQITPRFSYEEQVNLPYNLQDHMPIEQSQVEMDPMTSVMNSMERKPASPMMDPRSASLIADAVAAGLPALSATLSGASPSIQNRQFGRMDQYAQGRGNALVPSKANLLQLEGEDGEPYYEVADQSLGKKPYLAKKTTGAGAAQDRQFQPITLKNINSGEIAGAKQTSQGYFSQEGDQYDMREWLPFKPDELLRQRTVQGGSTIDARDTYSGKIRPVQSKAGLGDIYGGVPKEQAQAGIKAGEKAKASSQKALEAAEGADRAASILTRPNLSPELAAQGIFAIIKANNGERLSDSDYAQARGTEFKSYLRTAEEWANGKIAGNIPPRVLQAYAEAAKLFAESKRKEVESIKKSYVPKGMLPKEGQRQVEEQAGILPKVPKNIDWKNRLKGLK